MENDHDIQHLQGSLVVEHTYSKLTSQKLRTMMLRESPLRTLGAYNGQQAVQYVKAGLRCIYVSGWQVAACANTSGETYPDQSLYPVDSVPKVVYNIVHSLLRADKIQTLSGSSSTIDYLVPLVADGEAGFGGVLNVFELTRKMIEAGAAAIHFEDQVAAEKKCGHLGGKVLIPASQFVQTLRAARLASRVENCPDFVIIARTDAEAAKWISSDVDEETDASFLLLEEPRSPEGYYRFRNGIEACIARGLLYAGYADLVWFETSTPDLDMARRFAEAIHKKYPDYPLAYNCSPSFHWKAHLDDQKLQEFQNELGKMGYRFQFITLAGFHATNLACFEMASQYRERGMQAYSDIQQREMDRVEEGYTAVRHQQEVGTHYFDAISEMLGRKTTRAMTDSTEHAQF
jgi:isocitrate lyase